MSALPQESIGQPDMPVTNPVAASQQPWWIDLYELPPVGATRFGKDDRYFADLRTRLAQESRNERDNNNWIAIRGACLNLFNYGAVDKPSLNKFLVNHGQNDLLGAKDAMFREPVAIEIGVEDDGSKVQAFYWNGPQQIMQQAQDPATGQVGLTAIDVRQQFGIPPDAQDLVSGEKVAQKIDPQHAEQLMQMGVNPEWIVGIDNKSVADVYQMGFDSYWRRAFADEWLDQFVSADLKGGFNFALLGWEPGEGRFNSGEGHLLDNIPAQNAFPDPTRQFVWTWQHGQIHWVLRLAEAQRRFPKYAKLLRQKSKLGPPTRVDSQTEMGAKWDRDFQSRVVTLSVTWLTDQPAMRQMDEQTALGQGLMQEQFIQPQMPVEDVMQQIPTDQASQPEPDRLLVNSADGSEMQPDASGMYSHPAWPMRYVLRRFVMLDDILIEDEENAWPKMEIIHATCIGVEDNPFGFGLLWKSRFSQSADSIMAESMANNSKYFGNPASYMSAGLKKQMEAENKDVFIDPGTSLGLEDEDFMPNGEPKVGFIELPAMNQHHVEGRAQMGQDRQQLNGYTDALKGIAVTPGASGELQKTALNAAAGVVASISKHLQGSIKHVALNMLFSLTHFATVDQIFGCCKRYRREVLAAVHLNHAPNTAFKIDVALASGAGAQREQKLARLQSLNEQVDPASGDPIADAESVQEAANLDPETIRQRNERARQRRGSQQKPPAESISFKDLPPQGQSQMAQQAGIQLSPEEMALHQADQQAKEAAKAAAAKKAGGAGGAANGPPGQ